VLGGGLYALTSSGKKEAPPVAVTAPPPAAAPASVVVAEAPAPPPPPAAAQPFDLARDFEQVVARQSPDFHVDAATVKPKFRIDKDFLSFSVKSEKEGHLYVFLHGSDGVLLQVFPNTTAKSNRMRAGQTLVLPPPQSDWAMKASGPAGTDRFLAIVSAWPRDFSAIGLQVQDGYGQASVDAVAAAAKRQGGATPLFMGKAICPNECTDHFGATLFSSEQVQ